ncbi:hypothetical protein L5F23_01680 [Aliarcobacter butzleri]|uniref:hypothetical protein n=1 Tax=Aliarcobacter butzleri TaxID=28197 RepID=UPI001EDA3431|nr:hypothetical protein [Aliarcobacter butzleri]MCG3655411.1 hypothetical protein [Aliarcobacter butzleri]
MSKNIVFVHGNVNIKKENFKSAFKKLKKTLLEQYANMERWGGLKWINIDKVKESSNLDELLNICQWSVEYNLDNDIDTVKSNIGKIGEERLIFSTLSEFIENNSELIIYAENGSRQYAETRYKFNYRDMSIYNQTAYGYEIEELHNADLNDFYAVVDRNSNIKNLYNNIMNNIEQLNVELESIYLTSQRKEYFLQILYHQMLEKLG